MFHRISTVITILLLACFVTASAIVPRTDGSCDSGTQQYCCNSLNASSDPIVGIIATLLGIVSQLTAQVGLTCILGNSCSSTAVCCNGNNFSGLIVLGCNALPI